VPHPPLHDLVSAVAAPAAVLSDASGNLGLLGAQGAYVADRRILSVCAVSVRGHALVPLSHAVLGGTAASFVSVVDGAGDAIPDPTVTLRRRRTVRPDGFVDSLVVSSDALVAVSLVVAVDLATDLAPMAQVRENVRLELQAPTLVEGGVQWTADDGTRIEVRAEDGAALAVELEADSARFVWSVELAPRSSASLGIDVVARDASEPSDGLGPATRTPWSACTVGADDVRLPALVDLSLADLRSLLMSDGDDHFLAAGSPWFMTLFGRDSLWAARFLLPLGTELALGTLRTLARRAGARHDVDSAEQPGRILHEVRRTPHELGTLALPPVYYGSVDSTPLWICLLVDAWRWGAPEAEVEALIPAMLAALVWMRDDGDADGDGFLEYVDRSGRGLGNQGWKDSFDSVQWADGRLADAPIALSEVQAYAFEAATGAARLLRAFGRPGADEWDAWAGRLAERFRAQFWTEDDEGAYPGIALDRDKRLVDGIASNMGHLLGTGLLSAAESALVARRLSGPDLDSGFGLRTLTARSPRFGPLSYHGGSVWPHDTAIAVRGLAADGHDAVAASFVRGLLGAATLFEHRLPELFAGVQKGSGLTPYPYPPACRPQAWSAASSVALLGALLGLRPDVPAGRLDLRPMAPSPVGALTVSGLRVAGQEFRVGLAADGAVVDVAAPPSLRLTAPRLTAGT